jgi:hypothetical protein
MTAMLQRPSHSSESSASVSPPRDNSPRDNSPRVRPSLVPPSSSTPFTLDQELKPFGTWVDKPLWVPPKDSSAEMAESMLNGTSVFSSRAKSWETIVEKHRDNFTQVREIELAKASIRLPKGKLFVTVTERKHFDRITDVIPNCVQTRLDEFMAGPGKRSGVKVYYLKPLCVEVNDELLFTSREDVHAAIDKIKDEVFAEYRRRYLPRSAKRIALGTARGAVAIPNGIVTYVLNQRQKAIDAYQAKLEFRRRQTALDAAKEYRKHRTTECTFDDMLEMTAPLKREAVIMQYSEEQELSRAKRDQLLRMAAGQLPWFALASISAGLAYMAYVSAVSLTLTSPLIVCDPAFVAEFPGSGGVVMNIGHFDEIRGVRHVEL